MILCFYYSDPCLPLLTIAISLRQSLESKATGDIARLLCSCQPSSIHRERLLYGHIEILEDCTAVSRFFL